MSIAGIRIWLPDSARTCTMPKPCPYRKDGVCDAPRNNRGNSDSACHRITPRVVVGFLGEITG